MLGEDIIYIRKSLTFIAITYYRYQLPEFRVALRPVVLGPKFRSWISHQWKH